MCLIVFNWQPQQSQWLLLSANRDEFMQRPAAPMHEWPDDAGLFAGKDLEQGGTWLGVTKDQRWAALTNIRAPGAGPDNPSSRGALVVDYLRSGRSPKDWLQALDTSHYAPFNLLAGDRHHLWYMNNHPQPEIREVPPGIHSLSNAHLNSPWPKARLAEAQMAQAPADEQQLTRLLSRRDIWPDNELPATGVPITWERMLSAQFIRAPGYGTRCSTGIRTLNDDIYLAETTWSAEGTIDKEVSFQLHR